MIYVFGTRDTHLRTVPTPGHACPRCANSESLSLLFFSRYFFVSLLPVFPVGRETVLFCGHCQHKSPERGIPASLQPLAEQLKQQSKAPKWQYSGLLLLLAVPFSGVALAALSWVASLFYDPNSQRSSVDYRAQAHLPAWSAQRQAQLLAQPRVGDVYVQLPTTVDAAYMMRVQQRRGDTVYLSMCKKPEPGQLAYQRFRDSTYFQTDMNPLPISTVQYLYAQKQFVDVLRPE